MRTRDWLDAPAADRARRDPRDVTLGFLAAIGSRADLRAVTALTVDRALRDANRVLRARRSRRPLPLDGLPVLIKDNIDVAGHPSRSASPLFADHLAHTDATVVARVSAAGGIVLGKAALHELVFGATSDSPFYGRTRNAWNPDHLARGSSGGSAVAAAAGLRSVSLGTDTGGSVRVPAALNGVIGLRSTLGSVDQAGIRPIGPTLDTIGPIGRWARDCRAVHRVLSDPADDGDPTIDRPTVAVASMPGLPVPGPDQDAAVRAVAEDLRESGARLAEVRIEGADEVRAAAGTVLHAEAWARYADAVMDQSESFSAPTRTRLCRGAAVSAAQLRAAHVVLREWRASLDERLADVDVLLSPVSPTTAPPAAGAEMLATTAELTGWTLPLSATGRPSLSLPVSVDRQGLPIGVALTGRPGDDDWLLGLAENLQHRFPPTWPAEPTPARHDDLD